MVLLLAAPLLRPGYLLLRDAVSTPRSYVSANALGLTSAPRATPQDFAVALASHLVDGGVVVKALLLLGLWLAGWGAARLVATALPAAGAAGQFVAITLAIWNPYVAERLLQGHWSLLVGYGCLPWVATAMLTMRTTVGAGWFGLFGLAFWVALAGLTPSGLLLAATVAVVCVAMPGAGRPRWQCGVAAMVNLGIYGIVRFDLQLLGPGPRWWGLALLAVGGTSALYGVLQASVAADLKRLLAYSTTENMGLITLALGAATLFADTGAYGPASIAAAAAMLHMIAHAAFKSLAFMAAGSVLAATGLRDLDLLGGLARRMPATTVFFGVAALGACGLPLGAGFVSEWLLVQSLIHAAPGHDPIVALTTPLAVGVVALATGLSVAAMTKAFGIGFLARPRSTQAEAAREAPASMRAGMAIEIGRAHV